jgi:histidinol-phosphate aminotransferase
MPPRPKPGLLDIAAYVPGKRGAAGAPDPIKLSSNENVLGSSPAARAAYLAAAERLHLYPDGQAPELRAAIAARFGLEEDRLMFGTGSDELFSLLAQVYLEPGDNVVQPQHGFMSYRIAARACQAEVRFAPERDLTVDVEAVLAQVDDRTRIVFVANPGNPTGTWIGPDEVRRLHAGLPEDVLLVLDGAYAEFAHDVPFEDGLRLARKAQNVVVARTFSKLHGLAALRIGWAYGPAEVVDAVDRIRPAFNTPLPAQEAAVAALADEAFQHRSIALVDQERPWLTARLTELGLKVYPSRTNFVLVRFDSPAAAAEAEARLQGRGVLVRGVAGYGLADCLRITLGTREQNAAVVDGLALVGA